MATSLFRIWGNKNLEVEVLVLSFGLLGWHLDW